VAVALPVRDQPQLLRDCLAALAAQERRPDELIVVDDAPEPTLHLGSTARVLHSGGRGPYAARNLAWRACDADVILFLDVRSRPSPGWVDALLRPFRDPGVAITGSDVEVRRGHRLGAQAAHAQQSFLTTYYVERPFFRPYLPTCNLGVRRADLEAVGGFDEVRSGADADLCWRILDQPGRRLEVVPGVLMEWVPREGAVDYLRQNHRYGRSNYALRARWSSAGAPAREPVSRAVLTRRTSVAAARLLLAMGLRHHDRVIELVRHAAGLANEAGYAAAARDAPATN
jgi:glycosyltransferase involved in cell wall biosynthesis